MPPPAPSESTAPENPRETTLLASLWVHKPKEKCGINTSQQPDEYGNTNQRNYKQRIAQQIQLNLLEKKALNSGSTSLTATSARTSATKAVRTDSPKTDPSVVNDTHLTPFANPPRAPASRLRRRQICEINTPNCKHQNCNSPN